MSPNSQKLEAHLNDFKNSGDTSHLQDAMNFVDQWINSDRKGNTSPDYRKEIVKSLFKILKEVDSSFDHDYDKKHTPYINMAPPSETHLPAGVDPKEIKDDELRKKYESDLAENEKKIEYVKRQHSLRNLDQSLQIKIVNYLTEEYSGDPNAQDEIEQIGQEAGINQNFLDLIHSKMK